MENETKMKKKRDTDTIYWRKIDVNLSKTK